MRVVVALRARRLVVVFVFVLGCLFVFFCLIAVLEGCVEERLVLHEEDPVKWPMGKNWYNELRTKYRSYKLIS